MCSVCLRPPLLMEPEREQLETNGSAGHMGNTDAGISSCKCYWLQWKFSKLGTSLIYCIHVSGGLVCKSGGPGGHKIL